MSEDKRDQSGDSPLARCVLCGEIKEDVHVDVCVTCVEDTLRRCLPLLQRTLEERYGEQLDAWLNSGRFSGAHWNIDVGFEINREHLHSFLANVIADSLYKKAIVLFLPRTDGWIPTAGAQFTDELYKHCGEEVSYVAKKLIARAIQRLPTKAVEREIIEAASNLRSNAASLQGYAVEMAAFTTGNTLPPAASVLLTLRYGTFKRKPPYTGFWEGEIDPIWRECGSYLPLEIVRLIPEDESNWL